MAQVVFSQPNSPDEFGVALAPAELRSLDFTALDFTALTRVGVEYIRTYFPNEFNDFFASNGIIMMLELVSYIGGVLSERADILADEAFLPTARTKEATQQHLGLIGQKIQRATPAVVDVEISLNNQAPSEVRVVPGTIFSISGLESPVTFEIFRSPGDFASSIIIPPGKRGIIAYGIEGRTVTPVIVVAIGGPNQTVTLQEQNILDAPIFVDVAFGTISKLWRRVDIIEKSGPNDDVYEVRIFGDKTVIVFGDNIAGKAPIAGQVITIRYRIGGGIRGRIAAGAINEVRSVTPAPPSSAAVEAIFRNPSPSSGGTDEETIEQAKKRAPREFATHSQAVTGEDYGLLASQFKHPVYGAVAKAVATVRTGVDLKGQGSTGSSGLELLAEEVRAAATVEEAVKILGTNFVNENIVELYVLAEGPGDTLAKPNTGLKQGLLTFFSDKSVLTDEVRVLDGAIKPVDVEATVVMSRNADPGTVKAAVLEVISSFFDLRNFDMGTGLYLSSLYSAIQTVPNVKFVDIFKPNDDIITTNKLGETNNKGIGFNEVIILGKVDLKFFFEPGTFRTPALARM